MSQDELNAKRLLHKLLADAMEKMIEKSSSNVVQPLPLVDKKAAKRLSADDYISWQLILNEWNKVSDEGKKVISKLLFLNGHTLVETLRAPVSIMEEGKDTLEYLKEHPEFKGEEDNSDTESPLKDLLNALGEDM